MLVLALDCSAKSVSVAVAEDGKLIAEGFLNITLTHSETLMPLLEQTLSNARLTLKDIDALALTAGPGSFTGVRIGISAVKGLAFAEAKPVFAFSTLYAMALAFEGDIGQDRTLCGLMDARRNQFYNALFTLRDGVLTRLTEDRLITAEELTAELDDLRGGVVLMGDGAELYHTLSKEKFTLADEKLRIQRAAGMAVNASLKTDTTEALLPEALQTVYLRKSQAEREREERLEK